MTKMGLKLKLYPKKQQKIDLRQLFGNSRFVWNQMVSLARARYDNLKDEIKAYQKANETDPNTKWPKHLWTVNQYEFNNLLPRLKEEYPFLSDSDSSALQVDNEFVAQAYDKYFQNPKHFGKPKLKHKRFEHRSYTGKSRVRVVGKHYIKLPKLGILKCSNTSQIRGVIKRYTVRLEPTGHYTLSLILDVPNDELLPKTGKTIGIDLGLTHLAILSNGDKYETFKATYNESQAIKWQSKMSRRMHDAKNKIAVAKHHKALVVPELSDFKNWQRAQQLKARHQGKVAHKRLDYLHKLTTDLVRTYDVIAIEKLASQRMLKHKPLAKSISNASWAQFRTLLAYKCERYGKRLIEVDPAYTSQDCSTCGHRDGKKSLSIRYWTCSNCGSQHDRDVNAAKNIESRGLAQL